MTPVRDFSSFPELRDHILTGMNHFHVPGLAFGIIQNGQWFAEGFGITSVKNPLPITTETTFQIGSTTKTLTGTVVMMLCERGLLELDEPVKRYLPNLELQDPDVASGVTVRQLLNHTAGWAGDLFVNTGDGDDALELYVQKMRDLPQLTPLGEVWHYNNAEAVARELVLGPLGMHHSHFFPAEAMLGRFAVGHYLDEHDVVQVSKPWALARNTSSVGRINSSVNDQLIYAQFHLGHGASANGSRLLSAESMSEMQTPRVNGANGAKHAVSWFVSDLAGTRILRHGGATNGQMSEFHLVPERNFAWTILTNAEKGRALNAELNIFVQEQILGLKTPPPEHLKPAPTELEPYLGAYTERSMGTVIELNLKGEQIVRHVVPGDYSGISDIVVPPPPDAKCALLKDECLLVLEGDAKGNRIEFLRDSSGEIKYLRSSGRIYFKN
jgi:CubicO group peptidase (beta-lactamase class C family)